MEPDYQNTNYESERLKVLQSYDIFNQGYSEYLDGITSLSSRICETPIALISIVDEFEQHFISKEGTELAKSPRNISFCTHAIQHNELYEVKDTRQNELFVNNPFVTGETGFRFYAGMPLKDPSGYNLGTLCVIDVVPRALNEMQKSSLSILANAIVDFIILKQHKINLVKANEYLNKFFDLSPDFLCIAKPTGYFSRISSAFTKELGYTESELLEKPFLDFVHPEDKEKTLNVLNDINNQQQKVKFFRNRYECKNGSYIWLSWNAIPDNVTGLIFATARNVTELVKLNAELEKKKDLEIKLQEEKFFQLTNLTSKISHEILNPINLIIGFADVTIDMLKEFNLSRPIEEKEQILDQIKNDQIKITEYSRQIFNVIHRMNYDIRHENSNGSAQKKIVKNFHEINLLCKEFEKIALTNFKSRNPDFECEFVNHFDPNDPKCNISITDFGESILNLLYNCFEALIEKKARDQHFNPKVTLQTSVVDDMVQIRIIDNGVNIPEENFNKIFNPFFTTKKIGDGQGLGLTSSFGIIKSNNGILELEKSKDDETVFKISLPAA